MQYGGLLASVHQEVDIALWEGSHAIFCVEVQNYIP
jgi:hypothetical protein